VAKPKTAEIIMKHRQKGKKLICDLKSFT
jgi:hypothetical protein